MQECYTVRYAGAVFSDFLSDDALHVPSAVSDTWHAARRGRMYHCVATDMRACWAAWQSAGLPQA